MIENRMNINTELKTEERSTKGKTVFLKDAKTSGPLYVMHTCAYKGFIFTYKALSLYLKY
jgi:hypothetical protein